MRKSALNIWRRASRRLVGDTGCLGLVITGFALLTLTSGCSNWGNTGWSDPHKVQVQFYAPPGASVSLRHYEKGSSSVVGNYDNHRLEQMPEAFAVFNLGTEKTYDFKYTSAKGTPGVSIYGALDVYKVMSPESKKFVAHTFVPVSLPSEYYASEAGYFPVQGPSGVGLSQLELEHLREGDLIRKVYFVADLEKAWHTTRMIDAHVERLRSAETVLNTQLELVDSRYQSYRQDALYSDPTQNIIAANRDKSGANSKFIALESDRQRLENVRYGIRKQVEDLLNEKRIRTRLLDSMKIVNRKGSLVLATPENQWEFHDAAEQVGMSRTYRCYCVGPEDHGYSTGAITVPALGEIVMVMRVGGRHMQWGEAPSQSVAMNGDMAMDE